jgi:hypothetical protein
MGRLYWIKGECFQGEVRTLLVRSHLLLTRLKGKGLMGWWHSLPRLRDLDTAVDPTSDGRNEVPSLFKKARQ